MIEGYPGHFRNSNRITFPHELTEADARWWMNAIHPNAGVYPDELPSFLASGIPGSVSGVYRAFDSTAQVFELSLRSIDEAGVEIAFKNKRFEIGTGLVNDGETRVHPDWQEKGFGTLLMCNLIDFGRAIKARQIDIEARDIGRYAWLAMGFLPDRTAWKEKIAPRAVAYARAAFERRLIRKVDLDRIEDIVAEGDPRAAREIVGLKAEVEGLDRMNRPASVKLGKKILLLEGMDWNGSFQFDDDTLSFYERYRRARDAKPGHEGTEP